MDDLAPLTETELTEIRNLFAARMQAAGIENAELPYPARTIHFSQVNFSNFCAFEKFVFNGNLNFSESRLFGGADFGCSFFEGYVDFRLTAFMRDVYFHTSAFLAYAYFDRTVFTEDADFEFATFTAKADFGSAAFKGSVKFRSATFTGDANFSSTIFEQQAVFSSAKFKSTTTFKNAKFITHVPEFHAAELYEDTDFTLPEDYRENWPPLTGEGVMAATRQKKAYNRLRLYMNKSLQTDEEQFFHRMEMRCKCETEGWRYRWIYSVFGAVSDYGNSVLRPAGWLFVLWLVGALFKLELVKGAWWPDYHSIPQAAGWSFANLFPFFGFRRLYFDESLTASLKFIGGGQTVFGFILLFFLGLGLRNRFRLR